MLKTNFTYQRVTSNEELYEILDLQKQNLKVALSDGDRQTEGFVTVDHTFEVLKRMNDKCRHCIAKYNGKVVGYALCMLNEFRNDVPELIPMFNYMDGIIESKGLATLNYFIMGQVCIAKGYRGQGVFRELYSFLKSELSKDYDAVVTEVSAKNIRSSEAHKAIGFELLDKHTEAAEDWELIILKF
jgi:ribosomal protein S18 acetylase RimI-like enzyme